MCRCRGNSGGSDVAAQIEAKFLEVNPIVGFSVVSTGHNTRNSNGNHVSVATVAGGEYIVTAAWEGCKDNISTGSNSGGGRARINFNNSWSNLVSVAMVSSGSNGSIINRLTRQFIITSTGQNIILACDSMTAGSDRVTCSWTIIRVIRYSEA